MIRPTVKRRIILLVAIALTSCAPKPPTAPPDYSAAPPKIEQGFYVENTETVEVNVPRDQFFAWLTQTNLSTILTATNGMPAVQRTVMLEGDKWGEAGARRRVELDDGHYAVETILESSDAKFSYQVWGFTSQAGRLADYATGEFIYEDKGDTTMITWTYRFRPSSFAARIPLSSFVNNTFQGFMENGLANMKAGAEAAQK